MWFFWTLISLTFGACVADISPNYYCADMNPQPHINIEQLMGMWYGVEIITHDNHGQHYVKAVPSCPIIHLSEHKVYEVSTYSPLYKDIDYRHNYGERRDYNNRRTNDRNLDRDRNQYGRVTNPYRSNNYNIGRYGQKNSDYGMKRLRIWWDENGSGTEYLVRYNITRPGFWISSGPQNGSELEPLYSNFAGTVQVIKAVGNHLVLTFCHRLPDRQLFTIILSREPTLDKTELHSVHSLLNRRGLSSSAIKKVCSNGGQDIKFGIGALLLLLLSCIL